jgi:hypothetical protein
MVEKISSLSEGNAKESGQEDNGNSNSKLNFKFFKNQEIPEFFYCLEKDAYTRTPLPKA